MLYDLCIDNEIDILILSEIENIDMRYLLMKLSTSGMNYYHEEVTGSDRIYLVHRLKDKVNVIDEKSRYSAFSVDTSFGEIIIIGIHFQSLKNSTLEGLNLKAIEYSKEFRVIENERKHRRTVVVGDFNLNPFDLALKSANGFNAVMCPVIAKKKSRKISGKDYFYYYNPTWHLLGNINNEVVGSYYYRGDNSTTYWNQFDQVLIRPDLISKFDMDELKIITSINKKDLLTSSKLPYKKIYSDHLPIMFKIIEEE